MGKNKKKHDQKKSRKADHGAKKREAEASLPQVNGSVREALRCPAGEVAVADIDTTATPLFPGKGKLDAPKALAALEPRLDDLQERLYASGRTEGQPAKNVLLVLQGMDTSGKGGVVRHVIGMCDPQGVHIHAFKSPTAAEKRHDFLWRIHKALPEPGMIGIFDRSHYEDVLIQRVEQMAPADEIESRYAAINEFEQELAANGTAVIKCFLAISRDEQKQRLLERLDDPTKYWKYNPGDVDARLKWDAYMEAYGIALQRCNTETAPWFIVPADRKWYRNWAISRILIETLESMDLTWPPATFDINVERARVEAS
ncbi:MAG: polyphosphate kinase 2 family protein [Propionibacteriaceae bacterium]|jgi:PPK2 family polyphosphate:nucleotide phosphotransferase|nr:polyphosphate kinase 2 family protein [Propionibacteriaceae bacterium]